VTAADATARGDLIEALMPDAAFLAMAVRDRDPADIHTRLAGLARHELEALAVILAGMVDPDRSLADALGWVDFDEHGRTLDRAPDYGEGVVRGIARDPDQATAGPDYAAAMRALEGEPLTLEPRERTLAVRIGVLRGMTNDDIAAALGMKPDAVDKAWARVKEYARAAGLPVPRRPPGPGRNEAA
jgi:FixJ family two-component response regulator